MFVKDNEFTFLGLMLLLVGAMAFVIAIIKLLAVVAVIAILGLLAFFLLAKLAGFLAKLLAPNVAETEKLNEIEKPSSGR